MRIRLSQDATPSGRGRFGLSPEIIAEILEHARPLGHNEDRSRLNLGFGFVYYGLVRALRPRHVLVIGSGFGFSVVCLALGLRDNEAGRLTFVEPSFSALRDGPFQTIGGCDNWATPEQARQRLARFGVEDIVTHHKLTAKAFFESSPTQKLPPIDLAFIDGNHSFANVRHDTVETVRRCSRNAYLLLHDTNIYLRESVGHAGVKRWLNRLRRERSALEVVDFPLASGVALVRVVERDAALKAIESLATRRSGIGTDEPAPAALAAFPEHRP